MVVPGLERLLAVGIARYPISRLNDLADACGESSENFADVRFASLARALQAIFDTCDARGGNLPQQTVEALEWTVGQLLPAVVHSDDLHEAASLAASLRARVFEACVTVGR